MTEHREVYIGLQAVYWDVLMMFIGSHGDTMTIIMIVLHAHQASTCCTEA